MSNPNYIHYSSSSSDPAGNSSSNYYSHQHQSYNSHYYSSSAQPASNSSGSGNIISPSAPYQVNQLPPQYDEMAHLPYSSSHQLSSASHLPSVVDPASTAIVRTAAPTRYTPLTAYQYHDPTLSMKSTTPAASTSHITSTNPNKRKKPFKRAAGGELWEDPSLLEWDENDYRIFVGDLGNEVNDDMLARAFQKYPSFQKAKVVRDKRSMKSRGYGFVSFKAPNDFVKAMKEMNGKYVGNRPMKLRKSSWKDRNMDTKAHKKTKR